MEFKTELKKLFIPNNSNQSNSRAMSAFEHGINLSYNFVFEPND